MLWFAVQPTAAAADFSYGQRLYSIGDYAGALKIWRQLAEEGDARAQYSLALMHAKGMGVPQDNGKARFWAEKSAAQNFGPAKAMLTLLGEEPQAQADRNKTMAATPRVSTADPDSAEGRAQMVAEGVLLQLAGSSARFGDLRYGEVASKPAGEGFDVSLMDVTLHGAEETLDLGTIAMHIVPRDDRYHMVRMRLPEVLYLRGKDGPLSRIAIGSQDSEILWDNRLATSTVFSIVLGALQITGDDRPGEVTIGRIAAAAKVEPAGDRWSGPFSFRLTDLVASAVDKGTAASIGSLGMEVNLDGFDLPRYLRAMQGLRPGQERADNPDDQFVDLLRRFRLGVHMADIKAPQTADRAFSLKRADFSVAYADQGNDTAQLRFDAQHAGLAMVSDTAAEVWSPEAMTVNLRLDRLPVRTVTLALVTLGVDLALFGEVTTGNDLIARLRQDLAASGASLHLERVEVAGMELQALAQGELLSNEDAALGATGSLRVHFAGLEALTRRLETDSEDPVGEIARMLAAMSKPGPGGQGKRIEVTLNEAGELLVNGQPFHIPTEPVESAPKKK